MMRKDLWITEKQESYIEILSSYSSSKNEDKKDIEEYLKKVNKKSVPELSIDEASKLIQILLKRPAEYEFPCGKKKILDKRSINCYDILGSLESCLHNCPDREIRGNVNSCPYYLGRKEGYHYAREEYEDRMRGYYEAYDESYSKSYNKGYADAKRR